MFGIKILNSLYSASPLNCRNSLQSSRWLAVKKCAFNGNAFGYYYYLNTVDYIFCSRTVADLFPLKERQDFPSTLFSSVFCSLALEVPCGKGSITSLRRPFHSVVWHGQDIFSFYLHFYLFFLSILHPSIQLLLITYLFSIPNHSSLCLVLTVFKYL